MFFTWFRAESFAGRRKVLRSRCSLTLCLLSLRFTLVLLICGIVLRRRLAAGVFRRRDVQLHVQRHRVDYRTVRLQRRRGGRRGRRRELGVREDGCGRSGVLLLASSLARSLLLLLELLLLETALLLTEFGPAVFEPNLMAEARRGRVRTRRRDATCEIRYGL